MKLLKWTKAGFKSAINRTASVNFIVTRRCDLACGYCRARGKTQEITPDDWLNIARQLSDRFSVFVVSGGEPLLYGGLPVLIKGLSEYGITGLCTNLRRLDERNLASLHGLDYLNFSIDHFDQGDVSPKNAFGKIELLARYARKNCFELRGTAVITSRNVLEILEITKRLAKHGIPLNLQLVQNPGPADAFDTPEKLDQLEWLQEALIEHKRSGYLIDEPDDYIRGFVSFVKEKNQVRCCAGTAYLAIDSDGRPMPCQGVDAVGEPLHLSRLSLDEMMNSLRDSIPQDCRCWWNCYHRNSEWHDSPAGFSARAVAEWGRNKAINMLSRRSK